MTITKRPTRNDVIECAPINSICGCFDKDRNPCAFYDFKCPKWATAKCMQGTIMFALLPNAPGQRTPAAPSDTQDERPVSVPLQHLVGQMPEEPK